MHWLHSDINRHRIRLIAIVSFVTFKASGTKVFMVTVHG